MGGVGLLLLWLFLSRARTYARLLSDAHFRAIARGVPTLKRAALSNLLDQRLAAEAGAIRDASDPRVLQTPEGLALVYTVSQLEEKFVHHCSLSFPGQHVAQGTLDLFIQVVARLLNFPRVDTHFGTGASGVRHAECVLSPESHAAFAAQAPSEWSDHELQALRAEALQARASSHPESQ